MLSDRNWKLESILRLAFGVFVCMCIGTLLAGLIPAATDPDAPPSVPRMLISILCFQIGTLAFTWRLLREHQTTWAEAFGWCRNQGRALWMGVVAICLFLPVGGLLKYAATFVLDALEIETKEQLALIALRNAASPMQLVAMGITTILLAPIAEEILFRGVLYTYIKQSGYPRLALWGTTILFGAIHFNLTALIPLCVLALIFVWLYEQTDNLLAPIVAHISFNAINFALFFAQNGGKELPVAT